MVDEEQLLSERMANGSVNVNPDDYGQSNREVASESPSPPRRADSNQEMRQRMVKPNGMFRPASTTRRKLEAGVYMPCEDGFGVYLNWMNLVTDEHLELPDSANARVLEGIGRFWASRATYERHGLVYKRGVLVWGPPGGGKTVTAMLLARALIRSDGLVLFSGKPSLTAEALRIVRAIEPRRPLIVVMEDVDEIIMRFGEHELLAMLDGEFAIDNVVYLATTNYPERLGARVVNRPSRFDERIYVGMPSQAARVAYLEHSLTKLGGASLEEYDKARKQADRWAKDTEGLSIAHLRELVVAVMCLGQEYDSALKRLRAMCERPKDAEGFDRRRPGFE